ncbi:MAG: phosphatidylinositol glycan, class A [Parcubacteria bacterium C7867-008]|nr:MAG: phosphatidylinositol glycan, class A [Parcubacteria bacterium C7867-008]
MNILFVSNDPGIFEEGTAVRSRMRAYAEEVAKTGGVLHILSRAKKQQEITEGPLILHGVTGNKISVIFAIKSRARALVRTANIAVVSAQDPFEYGWAALKVIQGTNTKLHVQLHTDVFSPWFTRTGMSRSVQVRLPLLNRIRQSIADRVLPKAHGVRVVSQRIKDSLIARYGSDMESVSVLPIQVTPEAVQPVPFPEPVYPFTLFTASRLEPEKRIEDILYALAWVKDSYPSAGLVIAGEGSERPRLERLAKELHIENRVRFLGWRTDVRGLMRSAQCYIQASAYEGYSITLIEAALARVPIISSDVGIVGEVLKGNDSVLAAPPGDANQLLHNIRHMIEDSRMRSEYSMQAEAAVLAHLASARSTPADIIADITRLAV